MGGGGGGEGDGDNERERERWERETGTETDRDRDRGGRKGWRGREVGAEDRKGSCSVLTDRRKASQQCQHWKHSASGLIASQRAYLHVYTHTHTRTHTHTHTHTHIPTKTSVTLRRVNVRNANFVIKFICKHAFVKAYVCSR